MASRFSAGDKGFFTDMLRRIKGYLSFWNDNISYALRGCIVLELAFRGRISMEKDPSRRRFPPADRNIEVIDDTLTGEVLLDEALKMMKQSEKMSVSSWIDLMSGKMARQSRPLVLGPWGHGIRTVSSRC
jgi:hypothetical protein